MAMEKRHFAMHYGTSTEQYERKTKRTSTVEAKGERRTRTRREQREEEEIYLLAGHTDTQTPRGTTLNWPKGGRAGKAPGICTYGSVLSGLYYRLDSVPRSASTAFEQPWWMAWGQDATHHTHKTTHNDDGSKRKTGVTTPSRKLQRRGVHGRSSLNGSSPNFLASRVSPCLNRTAYIYIYMLRTQASFATRAERYCADFQQVGLDPDLSSYDR